jgi:hypothetical protein
VGRTTGTERDLASTITDVMVTITSRSSSVLILSNEISIQVLVNNLAKKAPIGILVVENEKIGYFTLDPHFDLEKNRKMV